MIYSFSNVSSTDKQEHYNLVSEYIWYLIIKGQPNDKNINANIQDTPSPVLKKLKRNNPIMDVLNTIIIPVTAATREPITTRTAKDIARQKIEYYQNMEEKERPRNMKDTIHCWHKRTIRETMPCLELHLQKH